MHDSFADPNTSEERNPVEILAEEFAARIRNGETPSIDDYVQKCPQFEKEIKLIFPSIQCVEKVSNEEADKLFPKGYKEIRPYLRTTPQPNK